MRMKYRFEQEKKDYSDYASGRVLLSAPGYPAFPVRLGSEVFQRCLALRSSDAAESPVVVFDPCCGAAYHLAALGLLHRPLIREIVAADIDPEILLVAQKNIALLTEAGMDRRLTQLADLHRRYGKGSHAEALESGERLKARLAGLQPLRTHLYRADATNAAALEAALAGRTVDVVFTDIPYGWHSSWRRESEFTGTPAEAMLAALLPVLTPASVVAVASDKNQRFAPQGFRRAEVLRLGLRKIEFLQPAG